MRVYIFLAISLVLTSALQAQRPEVGKVNWLRSIEKAKKISLAEKKDILIFFQEIPGCLTCRRFGTDIMSHPIIVDLIHESFVPLLIHNNKGGEDAQVLKYFGEPSWNNPVMRIIDAHEKPKIDRFAGAYALEDAVHYFSLYFYANRKAAPKKFQQLEEKYKTRKD